MKNRKLLDSLGTTLLALPIAISLALAPVVSAQTYAPPPPAGAQAQAAFSQQDLDQMLAPIALYPDSLLSQILMAATYPLEVAQAARWSRANPGWQGDEAVRAVEQKDWDPSVKSLVAFPQILAMMDEKPEWTERLGDAFLAQESQVMDSVQHLRQRAYAEGQLRSNDRIRVVSQGPAIVIVPADPEVVYVPYYDPTVVYGNWWWPEPPVYWAPWRGYHPPRQGVFFSWGTGIPVASGFFFGAFDWPRRYARVVNVHPYYYNRTVVINRQVNVHDNTVARNVHTAPGVWQHDPAHRRGAPYRGTGVRASFAADGAQIHPRAAQPAAQPQARAIDNNRNTVRESRARVDEHTAEATRRAGIRQETRPENRSDDRRRQEVAARIEHRNEDTRRREASARVENRARPPEIRREAPPAVRAALPTTQPRVEQHAVRPVPKPVPQPRTESAVRPAPPHTEAPRVRAPQDAAQARESRPAGGHGPRRGGDEQRRGGREREG